VISVRFATFPDTRFFGKFGTHQLRNEVATPMPYMTPIFHDAVG
jgi:hypothetical protein